MTELCFDLWVLKPETSEEEGEGIIYASGEGQEIKFWEDLMITYSAVSYCICSEIGICVHPSV